MPKPTLTNDIIVAAIAGFEVQKQYIDERIAELRSALDGSSHGGDPSRPKRKFSAQALKRMREGQQRRWARFRGESTPQTPKPKRRLSAAGRKAIVDALKKRWAVRKAAEGKAGQKNAKKRAA